MGFISSVQGWFHIQKSINMVCHIHSPKKKNHMIPAISAENNSTGKSDVHPLLKTTGLEDARFKSKIIANRHLRYCLKCAPCDPRPLT